MNFLHTTTYIDLSAVSHIFSAPIPNYGEVSSLPNNWLQHCRIEYDKERSLYDSLITEAYNKNGVCMTYYIVSFSTENQKLFGEDNNKKIVRKFDVMGYMELPKEETMFTQFGIEGLDSFEMYFSIRHFNESSTYDSEQTYVQYDSHVPIEGDMIKLNYAPYLLEVIHVKQEEEMFLQGKHSYTLNVRPLRDNHESLSSDTSATMTEISAFVDNIDDIFDIGPYVTSSVSAIDYESSDDDVQDSVFGSW